MKALVTPKPVPKYAKPSYMLGFVLCASVILTIALCIWQISLDREASFKVSALLTPSFKGKADRRCYVSTYNKVDTHDSCLLYTSPSPRD